MKVSVEFGGSTPLVGRNEKNLETRFDWSSEHGGTETAASPMEILLQSVAACSAVDVIEILRKKRKELKRLVIDVIAERAESHPRVFTKAHLRYEAHSADATASDIEQAVQLSQDKYCSVSAMIKQSGCVLTWESKVVS